MGCEAESPKTVKLVRGQKELDVWVRDVQDGMLTLIFVECKFWGTNVPQNEVHAFRTVVADGGAHKGFIITQKGFQDGAYDAVEKSNVDILTWEEFNKLYFLRWEKAVAAELAQLGSDMAGFSLSPFYRFKDRFKRKLTEPLAKRWAELRHVVSMTETAAVRNFMAELDAGPARVVRPEFDPDVEPITEENMFVTFRTHREWYEYIKPRLHALKKEVDDWYALYEREGGDAAFRTKDMIDAD